MCGIAGLVVDAPREAPAEALGRAMCAQIVHRGPDDEGIFRDRRALLGMRRLSIIDLATGHQPVHNEERTVHAVFNGEIYNYRALRAELESLGHRFYTSSDSETIVHAYEQWGEGFAARLDGMFAIALWDSRAERLVLARDRFGKKPLYLWRHDGMLAFASELKSLRVLPGFPRELDRDAIASYVAFGYVPTAQCAFRGVEKLPPAHYLVHERGRSRVIRYWEIALEPKLALGEEEAKEQLAALLDEAVRCRLMSDVPFGAFLSGGLDSSVVVALMARHMSQPVKTFSIGFREARYNELPDARRVAQHIGTEHHELVVEPDAVGCSSAWSGTSTSRSPIRRRSRPTWCPSSPRATSRWCCRATAATRPSPVTTATCARWRWSASACSSPRPPRRSGSRDACCPARAGSGCAASARGWRCRSSRATSHRSR